MEIGVRKGGKGEVCNHFSLLSILYLKPIIKAVSELNVNSEVENANCFNNNNFTKKLGNALKS